jgi:hypothetical protein
MFPVGWTGRLAALRVSDLSPANAKRVFGAIPARLSLPAKTRFPEIETGPFGDWVDSVLDKLF